MTEDTKSLTTILTGDREALRHFAVMYWALHNFNEYMTKVHLQETDHFGANFMVDTCSVQVVIENLIQDDKLLAEVAAASSDAARASYSTKIN